MTARAADGDARRAVATMLPIVVAVLAGLAARTPIAAAYPAVALLLLVWIVADTMMLALLARTEGTPSARPVLGVLAGASLAVAVGVPPALRTALLERPWLAGGMAVLILAQVVSAGHVARTAWRGPAATRRARCERTAVALLPPLLVQLAMAELTVLHMALFRWGGAADVPADARAFGYHRHLTPMCAALLVLSAVEVAVYHLLLAHWSRGAALVLFVLSDVGFVYLLGLTKSLRYRPILLTPDSVRVRAGFLIDRTIPLSAIAAVEAEVRGEEMRDPATLNAALLAWPNVVLRLATPLPGRRLLRAVPPVERVAFRLDEPASFIRLLRWRLGQVQGGD